MECETGTDMMCRLARSLHRQCTGDGPRNMPVQLYRQVHHTNLVHTNDTLLVR